MDSFPGPSVSIVGATLVVALELWAAMDSFPGPSVSIVGATLVVALERNRPWWSPWSGTDSCVQHWVSTVTSPNTSTWQARRIFGFFLRSPRSQNFSINVRELVFDEGETATRSVPHKPLP